MSRTVKVEFVEDKLFGTVAVNCWNLRLGRADLSSQIVEHKIYVTVSAEQSQTCRTDVKVVALNISLDNAKKLYTVIRRSKRNTCVINMKNTPLAQSSEFWSLLGWSNDEKYKKRTMKLIICKRFRYFKKALQEHQTKTQNMSLTGLVLTLMLILPVGIPLLCAAGKYGEKHNWEKVVPRSEEFDLQNYAFIAEPPKAAARKEKKSNIGAVEFVD